jgi:hypothetical protein
VGTMPTAQAVQEERGSAKHPRLQSLVLCGKRLR